MYKYRSGLEIAIAAQLDVLGIDYEYECEKFEYSKKVRSGKCGKCGTKEVYQKHRYTPDFTLANGVRIEGKGRFTPSDRAKLLAVKAANPELDLRLVFGCNNKLNKKSKDRYFDWAEKHGFKYSLREVPKAWVK